MAKPKVIVFDLDYTLWPFWVDTHVQPPFKKSSSGQVLDSSNKKVNHYPDSPKILQKLFEDGYKIAVASRTGEVKGARQLIDLFGWQKYFTHYEIYPGCKVKHLTNIKNFYKVEFKDIIFFDDESRNIRDTTELGVYAVMVRDGISSKLIDEAFSKYSNVN